MNCEHTWIAYSIHVFLIRVAFSFPYMIFTVVVASPVRNMLTMRNDYMLLSLSECQCRCCCNRQWMLLLLMRPRNSKRRKTEIFRKFWSCLVLKAEKVKLVMWIVNCRLGWCCCLCRCVLILILWFSLKKIDVNEVFIDVESHCRWYRHYKWLLMLYGHWWCFFQRVRNFKVMLLQLWKIKHKVQNDYKIQNIMLISILANDYKSYISFAWN